MSRRASTASPRRTPAAPADFDEASFRAELRADVIRGLSTAPKTLPCRYLYDERGAALFERICHLSTYYLTRAELAILERHRAKLAALLTRRPTLIELGTGSGVKTRILIDAAPTLRTYYPVDLSAAQLEESARALRKRYPKIDIHPLFADYERPLPVPRSVAPALIYFPGSTIGNLEPPAAARLLVRLARTAGPRGALLIGVDRKKDPGQLHAAYNDDDGLTAAFNLNLLDRIRRELRCTLDPHQFRHHAAYSPILGCVEMFLVSREAHQVEVEGRSVAFAEGEAIRTERSYKYSVPQFTALCEGVGLQVSQVLSDPQELFSLYVIELG